MKLIQELSEMIEEEINDTKKYAMKALEVRDEYPELASVFMTLSKGEGDHQNQLHEQVVKIIRDYRMKQGEPPSEMMAVYEYLHKKHIADSAEAKRLQEMYSGR